MQSTCLLNSEESWKEIVERNKEMHKKKFTHIQGFDEKIDYVYDNSALTKKVLPSMRSMQFVKPIDLSPNRIYNQVHGYRFYDVFEAMFCCWGHRVDTLF